jgi:hypothetical protein
LSVFPKNQKQQGQILWRGLKIVGLITLASVVTLVGFGLIAAIVNNQATELTESSIQLPDIPSIYSQLENLLKSQNFKEADLQTKRVMVVVAKRQKEGYLRVGDAENFPCKELRTIDNLWLRYGQGKFGISVQQEIYKNLGGTKQFNVNVWESFGDRVGWRKQGLWLSYSNLNFSLSAPTGHLPNVHVEGVSGLLIRWSGPFSLLSRHVECNP